VECGASDPERSSFLLAEEENAAIEPMIVRERRQGRTFPR
jgi:hypothetical protein